MRRLAAPNGGSPTNRYLWEDQIHQSQRQSRSTENANVANISDYLWSGNNLVEIKTAINAACWKMRSKLYPSPMMRIDVAPDKGGFYYYLTYPNPQYAFCTGAPFYLAPMPMVIHQMSNAEYVDACISRKRRRSADPDGRAPLSRRSEFRSVGRAQLAALVRGTVRSIRPIWQRGRIRNGMLR